MYGQSREADRFAALRTRHRTKTNNTKIHVLTKSKHFLFLIRYLP